MEKNTNLTGENQNKWRHWDLEGYLGLKDIKEPTMNSVQALGNIEKP